MTKGHGRVYFVEGYHSVDQRLQDAWDSGLEVWNASRPLMGDCALWEGDFRHGVFYSALPTENECDRYQIEFRERNIALDASLCVFVSRETIEAHRAALAAEYPDADLSVFSYEEMAQSWLDQQ